MQPNFAPQPATTNLVPCSCKSTGHDPSCWQHSSGIYVNGVKVAPLYNIVQVPIVVYGPFWR